MNCRPFWHWPHLLGLDAPAVAVVWQWQWAACLGVTLTWVHHAVMFLAVWAAYLADRVADGRRDSARHAFADRYATPVVALAAVSAAAGFVVAMVGLSKPELLAGFGLAGLTGVYFAVAHGFARLWERTLLKEWAVGVIFAAGTATFPLLASGGIRSVAGPLAAFAGLAFLNGVLITHWERGVPRRRWVMGSLLILVLGGLVMGENVWLAISLSAGCHMILDRARQTLSASDRRAVIDWCLLTPLVF